MKIDPYSILIALSVLVVLSYGFNYLSEKLKIPAVLLLIAAGMGLRYAADSALLRLPAAGTLLELLGIAGLILIVLEAALDLSIHRQKLKLILRAFISALALLGFTSFMVAFVFTYYYGTNFRQALLHAIPLSVVSSAIAIPSVSGLSEVKREFVIYESTFSDILGIIAFNLILTDHASGLSAITSFGTDILSILAISIFSTGVLIFLLNRSTSPVRFFLTFAILILAYSLSKLFHLPSLVLVLCFGLVLNNFRFFENARTRRILSFDKLSEVTRELKMMTTETAFIIRTFFFLLFGYSINLETLQSTEVLFMGLAIIFLTIVVRFFFLRFFLAIKSAPITLIAPRGLITILLFYSIPETMRLEGLSDGVLLMVIAFTGIAMTVGLLLNKQSPGEKIEEAV